MYNIFMIVLFNVIGVYTHTCLMFMTHTYTHTHTHTHTHTPCIMQDHRRFQYDAMVDDIAKIKRTLHRLDGFMEQMAHSSCKTMAVPLTPSPLIHHNTFDLEFEQSLLTQQPKSGTAEDFFSDPNL